VIERPNHTMKKMRRDLRKKEQQGGGGGGGDGSQGERTHVWYEELNTCNTQEKKKEKTL